PKHLYVEPDEDAISALARGLLQSPRLRNALSEERAERSKSDQELDRLIGRVVPAVGLRVEHRPSIQKLYERLPAVLADAKLPTLSRAVRSQFKDVLLDSVAVEPHDPVAAIRAATSRVGRAFWYYNKLRPDIERTSGRQVRTVGV